MINAEIANMQDFRAWLREKQAKYLLLAVQAPLEEVAGQLTKLVKVEDWQKKISLNGSLADLPDVPLLQLQGSSWTLAYWAIGRCPNLKQEGRQLSEKLDTRVIEIWAADTSGWTEWRVWERGEEREEAGRDQGDDVYFESSLQFRRDPDGDEFESGELNGEELRAKLTCMLDELLTNQGICFPSPDCTLSEMEIDRLDLFVLPSQPLGMIDFQKSVYEGHPEYAIFAVKAPIEMVAPEVAKYCRVEDWQKDIKTAATIWDAVGENEKYQMPMIQPKDNNWTVVYWIVGEWENLADMCSQLSSDLQTRVMEIGEEDTSAAVGYSLYENGKRLEYLEWCPGEEITFESELRDEPEFDNFDEDESDAVCGYINDRFIAEGIYIPPWELEVTDEWLERVDLMPPYWSKR
ncbi:hypothetical protein K9N68_03880 [Kovacikia minuta CCNUW1]|uniref:hypothetical protein n=1 Tax=Kovacikia minuta TaxID=2931930 RepID=UPI001CCEA9C8|nr:hypothetical protein [Kovacikia minuta]UBF27119.1 hypothetical protein K9N68_03880 [Kovacikia minuta CCNUW1]